MARTRYAIALRVHEVEELTYTLSDRLIYEGLWDGLYRLGPGRIIWVRKEMVAPRYFRVHVELADEMCRAVMRRDDSRTKAGPMFEEIHVMRKN